MEPYKPHKNFDEHLIFRTMVMFGKSVIKKTNDFA